MKLTPPKKETQRQRDGLPDLRRATDFGLRPNAYRRGSYRLTPASRGFGHLAAVEHPPKSRALSGRGGRLDPGPHVGQTPLVSVAVCAGRGLGLVFQVFVFPVFKVNRACRFAKQIGAQASGDARALRHLVNFLWICGICC
jgi:hypothetical protein